MKLKVQDIIVPSTTRTLCLQNIYHVCSRAIFYTHYRLINFHFAFLTNNSCKRHFYSWILRRRQRKRGYLFLRIVQPGNVFRSSNVLTSRSRSRFFASFCLGNFETGLCSRNVQPSKGHGVHFQGILHRRRLFR